MRRKRKPRILRPGELTEDQILAWADAYRKLTGRWPTANCRPRLVQGAPAEKWSTINGALEKGQRGLAGGSSLARLLAARRGVRNPHGLPPLTIRQILKWCDELHEHTGKWPHKSTSPKRDIPSSNGERWPFLDEALRRGRQGLPGRSSLAQLLAEHRGVRNIQALRRLTVGQILKWCDEFHECTGKWPNRGAVLGETIAGSGGETWRAVTIALHKGTRGLRRGGSSLARLLEEHRGVRNRKNLPRLTVRQILTWADAWHERTGRWPQHKDWRDPIPGAPGEKWGNVMMAVATGCRGLPGGLSFWDLLAEHRGVRNIQNLPELTPEQILVWADAFHAKTGQWPTARCSPQEIPGTFGEKWCNVAQALIKGLRGLPSGFSLPKLLAERRGVRNVQRLPPLRVRQVLVWADAFHTRTGKWPTARCEPQEISGTGGERWSALDSALQNGNRGLPGGSSLAELLAERRGVRNTHNLPDLTVEQILAWADAFHARTGEWPTSRCLLQEIPGTGGEKWFNVSQALNKGQRGLPGGSSLARLLARHRGVPKLKNGRRHRMDKHRR